MSKTYKILFLSVGLFFITNEVWMAQPSEQPERKIALFSRAQNLAHQDSSDSKQVDEAEELADSLLCMDLSSEQISIEDFITCVSEMSLLIEDNKVSSDVKSLIAQLQVSKREPEKEVIGIAKRLVKKLREVIAYEKIISFLIRKKNLPFAQALFKLDFPLVVKKSPSVFEMIEDDAYMFDIDIQKLEVYKYLKANKRFYEGIGCSKECLAALQAGAYVNVRFYPDNTNSTPLHKAAWSYNEKVTDILIAAGADVNAQDLSGYTPLHSVIVATLPWYDETIDEDKVKKCKRIVGKLLAAKARTDIRDDEGLTVLDLAKKYGLADVFAEFGIH